MINVLFLILNYKTYSDTIKVVHELLDTDRNDFKILIVDNSSPNNSFANISREFADNSFVDVIFTSSNEGYAKGNNYGLRYAKKYSPKYVCIMNNDVHFSWVTIESMCDIYEKVDNPAIIAPIQLLPGGKSPGFFDLKVPNLLYDIRMYTYFFKPQKHIYKSNTGLSNVQKVGYIPGALLFTKYSVFEKLGFFNTETFLFCEERFTGKAVSEAGMNNYIVLDLFYLHEHSKTIKNEVTEKRQRKLIHEGRLLYHKKFSKCPSFAIFVLNLFYHLQEFEFNLLSYLKK